jgi:ubiquinone/menaquinone biosynthesis C-methylase UbiE
MADAPRPRTTQERIQRLLGPERLERLDPEVVLGLCQVDRYDTVADIGCGPGYFTLPLAKRLTHGKLYALDVDDEMLAACRQRVAAARLGNVEVLKCGQYDFPVARGSLDVVFLALVLHGANLDKPRFLQAVGEVLRPRGWCWVLEWYRQDAAGGPPLERLVDPDSLEALARKVGFEPRGWRDLNGDQYLMPLHQA